MSKEATFRFPVSDRAYNAYLSLGSALDGRVDKFNAIIAYVLATNPTPYFIRAKQGSSQKPYRFVTVRSRQHSDMAKQCNQKGVYITRFLSAVLENLPEEFLQQLINRRQK